MLLTKTLLHPSTVFFEAESLSEPGTQFLNLPTSPRDLTVSALSQSTGVTCVPLHLALLHGGCWGLNSGPHACVAGTLLNESSPLYCSPFILEGMFGYTRSQHHLLIDGTRHSRRVLQSAPV